MNPAITPFCGVPNCILCSDRIHFVDRLGCWDCTVQIAGMLATIHCMAHTISRIKINILYGQAVGWGVWGADDGRCAGPITPFCEVLNLPVEGSSREKVYHFTSSSGLHRTIAGP